MKNPLSSVYPKLNRSALGGIWILSLFFCAASIPSSDYTLIPITQEFQDEIKKQSATVIDLSADFVQSKYIVYLNASVESKGRIYFKKPGKIRWQYTEPYEFVLIINEGQFQLADPQNKMHFREKENAYFNEIGALVQESLNGKIMTNNNYDISLFSNSAFYKLSMLPTNSNITEIIEKVEIIIERESFQLHSFSFSEPSGDVTNIRLNNTSTNLSLPNSKFSIQ